MNESPSDAGAQPGAADAVTVTNASIAAGQPQAPGAWLAAVRTEQGLTVEQVASQLNLAPRQVMALEADDYAALPGMVIARGFLRAYAKLLKVDPAPLLAMLGAATPAAGAAPFRPMAASSFSQARMPAMHGRPKRTAKGPLAALAVVVVLAAGASYMLGWWPEALTRRLGQLRGNVTTDPSSQASVDAGAAARAADAGGAAGSATGVNASPEGAGNALSSPSVTGDSATDADSGRTSTTILANPAAASASGGLTSSGPAGQTMPVASATSARSTTSAANTAPVASTAPARGAAKPGSGSAPEGASKPATETATVRAAAGGTASPLVLHVQQDSWVEIKRADHSVMVSRLMKAGSVETFEIDQPSTLIIGNLAGVEASLRGAPLQLARGAKGNVAKLRIE